MRGKKLLIVHQSSIAAGTGDAKNIPFIYESGVCEVEEKYCMYVCMYE